MIPKSVVNESVIFAMLARAKRTPSGCFVEVGVYQGGSAWYLAELARDQGRELYLYDTFTGIPYQGMLDSHRIGEFCDTSIESVRSAIPDAHVIQGVFPQSAVDMPPIAFAHLDCDQERSYREAIEYLLPRMVQGGRMWFDDSPCLEGARLVVESIFGDRANIVKGKHTIEIVHGVETRRSSR